MPWLLFFNALYEGDIGDDWVPTFTSLTETGGPATITGHYIRITRRLVFFRVDITPYGGGDTSATAGTTTINNFPLTISNNGIVFAVSGLAGSNSGMVRAADNQIYVPGWSAVTVGVTVIGLCEVN